MGFKVSTPATALAQPTTDAARPAWEPYSALVIGADVVGVCVAYELGRRGYAVTVLDKGGEIANCVENSFIPTTWVQQPLQRSQWIASETPWGSLFEVAMAKYLWKSWRATSKPAVDHKYNVTGNDLLDLSRNVRTEWNAELFPNGDSGGGRGVYLRQRDLVLPEAYCEDPLAWTATVAQRAAKEYKVKFVPKVHVDYISVNPTYGSQEVCKSVMTRNPNGDADQYLADRVVLADGGEAPRLLLQSYFALPLINLAGYSMLFRAKPNGPLAIQQKNSVSAVAIEPNLVVQKTTKDADTWCVSGLFSFDSEHRLSYNHSYVAKIFRDTLKQYGPYTFDNMVDSVLVTHRFIRTMTPDGLPMVGRLPRNLNLYACCGHGFHGFAWAPGSARLVVDIMEGKKTPGMMVSHTSLAPDRFFPHYMSDPTPRNQLHAKALYTKLEEVLMDITRILMW